jgi:hypothetical protein
MPEPISPQPNTPTLLICIPHPYDLDHGGTEKSFKFQVSSFKFVSGTETGIFERELET